MNPFRCLITLFSLGLVLVPMATAQQSPSASETFNPQTDRRASATPGIVFPSRFGPEAEADRLRSVVALPPYLLQPRSRSTTNDEEPISPGAEPKPDSPTSPQPAEPTYQNANPPNITARFGAGMPYDHSHQIEAQYVGVARQRALQDQLQAYARPMFPWFGFGYGFGIGGPIR